MSEDGRGERESQHMIHRADKFVMTVMGNYQRFSAIQEELRRNFESKRLHCIFMVHQKALVLDILIKISKINYQ